MRYAFVFISILAIWVAVIAIAAAADNFSVVTAQGIALLMTVILFIIGFRRS
jgi:hypothetical protein